MLVEPSERMVSTPSLKFNGTPKKLHRETHSDIFWTWPALCLSSHSPSFCSAAHYQKWWTGNSPHRTSTCCPTAFQSDNRGGTSCAVEESFETVHHADRIFWHLGRGNGGGLRKFSEYLSCVAKMGSVYAEGGIRECVFVSQWRTTLGVARVKLYSGHRPPPPASCLGRRMVSCEHCSKARNSLSRGGGGATDGPRTKRHGKPSGGRANRGPPVAWF